MLKPLLSTRFAPVHTQGQPTASPPSYHHVVPFPWYFHVTLFAEMAHPPVDPKLPEVEVPVFPHLPYSHSGNFPKLGFEREGRLQYQENLIFSRPLLLPGSVTMDTLRSLVSLKNSRHYSECSRV